MDVLWTCLYDGALAPQEAEGLQQLLTEAAAKGATGRVRRCSRCVPFESLLSRRDACGMTCVLVAPPAHTQYFDHSVAEHLFLHRMVHPSANAAATTMSGFICLRSYLLHINAQLGVIDRIADAAFEMRGHPSELQVRSATSCMSRHACRVGAL